MRIADTKLINDANIVSYYKLEDTSDSKGTVTLTNNNTATFVAARYSNGGSLGASNTNKFFSNATNNPYGIGTGAFSIVGWVQLATESGSGALYEFINIDDTTNQLSQIIEYQDTAGVKTLNFFRVRNGVAGDGPTVTIPALGTTNWYHLGFTYDGSFVNAYINGQLIGGPTAASGTGTSGAVAGVTFGVNRNDAASNPASIIYDDWGIFTRALTQTEIRLLAQEFTMFNVFHQLG